MMCDMGASAAASAIIGAIVAAAGTTVSIISNKKEAEYNIKSMIKQAKVAEENAGQERQEALIAARKERLNLILNMNKQKSKFASSNLAVSSSTLSDLTENIKDEGEMSALNKIELGQRRASNYINQTDSYLDRAHLTAFNSQMNGLSSAINLGGKISNIGLKYLDAKIKEKMLKEE